MKNVLLIDDDPITNFIHKKLLESTGLVNEILIAQSGKQGLDLLIEASHNGSSLPDLILLDINMPILNGFQFLTQLYRLDLHKSGNAKIVMLSSSDSLVDKAKARDLGIETYIVKPMTSEVLSTLLL